MICFVTTPGHGYALDGLRQWPFRAPCLPVVRTTDYHALFRATSLPRATYVFADIERLYPWERRLAAERFRSLQAAGLRCLNDPARIPTRYALLRSLAREGINAFGVYLAEDRPLPVRFPVFVRDEISHKGGVSALLHSQAALERHLAQRTAQGESLSDCMVVEYVDVRRPDGLWMKLGTFIVGEALHCDHIDYSDGWIVKHYEGTAHLWTEAVTAEERKAVQGNETPEGVRRAFEIAGVEWGRADHAPAGDGHAVFEVNTNPYLSPLTTARDNPHEFFARRRLGELLGRIDSVAGMPVEIGPGPQLARFGRRKMLDAGEPLRP